MMPFSAFRTACLPLIAAVAVACGGGGGGGGGGAAPDNTAPTVTIHFPPPTSMTEGLTVTVRGTASDRSAITSLQVNGENVSDDSDDGSYATWSAVVSLATGANTLTASVEDSAGNTDTDAASVSVLSDDTPTDFPNADAPVYFAEFIAVNPSSNVAYISNSIGDDDIMRVNLSTGARDVFSAEVAESQSIMGLHYDDNQLWATQRGLDFLIEVDTSSGDRTDTSVDLELGDAKLFRDASSLISSPNNSDSLVAVSCDTIFTMDFVASTYSILTETDSAVDDVPLGCMKDVIFVDGSYVVTREAGAFDAALVSVDATTSERSIVSSNSNPNSDPPLFEAPHSIIHDTERNRFIVSDTDADMLIVVDEGTRVRSVFSGDGDNGLLEAKGMYFDSEAGVIYAAVRYGLAAVDIESGDIVVVAYSLEPG